MPKVAAIFIKEEKNSPRREIQSGIFRAGYGLEGDIYSGGDESDRQICALRAEDRTAVEADPRDGLCFSRFTETLRIEGVELKELTPGRKLRIGDMTAEVRKRGKRCWPDCAIVMAKENPCALRKGALFIAVLESGIVRKGDEIVLL